MKCVVDALNHFCSMSGQEVSQEKTSVLFSRNVNRGLKMTLLSISGFKETSNFGKYLGVPLHGRALKKADFQYLLDQVSNKLSMWKATHLSFAGRVTLAKSVIEAVPIYPMMSTLIPKACLEEIQKMQRNFIWGDTAQKKRFHAVGWETITAPKWMGGLGMRDLAVMNTACLGKLGWKLKSDSKDLWCNVLRNKYNRGNVQPEFDTRASDSSLWKALINIMPLLEEESMWCIGNGRSIDAWSDTWIRGWRRVLCWSKLLKYLSSYTEQNYLSWWMQKDDGTGLFFKVGFRMSF
jgi:hypothetical protein